MTTPDTSHAPDFAFGCSASWGEPAVRDGGIHVCNLSNTHHGQPHECKCGEISTEPKPVPGPPVQPRCRECGGPFSVGGAIRYHQSDCARGNEFARQAAVQREIEEAITIAVRARRQDTEFMDRLHTRIKADGVILERLAERAEGT